MSSNADHDQPLPCSGGLNGKPFPAGEAEMYPVGCEKRTGMGDRASRRTGLHGLLWEAIVSSYQKPGLRRAQRVEQTQMAPRGGRLVRQSQHCALSLKTGRALRKAQGDAPEVRRRGDRCAWHADFKGQKGMESKRQALSVPEPGSLSPDFDICITAYRGAAEGPPFLHNIHRAGP